MVLLQVSVSQRAMYAPLKVAPSIAGPHGLEPSSSAISPETGESGQSSSSARGKGKKVCTKGDKETRKL